MLLHRLLKPRAQREQEARDAALADPLIDRIVAATDRRLVNVKDLRRRLRAPVASAHERLAAMVALIPGPYEVGAAAWSRDFALRPLFARAADAASVFNEDAGVRAFFDAHPASDCLAMLGLLQSERRVLATISQGGSLQAEAARTTMSFGEPRILAPAVDEASVRAELATRCIEYLAMRALEQVGTLRVQRRESEKERALLQAELRLAERRGAGLGAMGGSASARDKAAVERDLARVVSELSQGASGDLLPALVDALVELLGHPDDHLAIEPGGLALDAMNFVVPPSPQAITPCVATLRLAARGSFAVLVARFPRAELQAPVDRLAEAARYL